MLNNVLQYLNNYFPIQPNLYNVNTNLILPSQYAYQYSVNATFTTTDTISGDFTDLYLAGEYIRIQGSRLNDGVYLIKTATDTELTIDATLDITISTEPEISCLFTKCFIPSELIAIISDIKTYDTSSADGISSESQGGRSVSYGSGGSGWQGIYMNKLSPYKKLRW